MAMNSLIALLVVLLVQILPETKGRPLIQTVEDHITYSISENHIVNTHEYLILKHQHDNDESIVENSEKLQ